MLLVTQTSCFAGRDFRAVDPKLIEALRRTEGPFVRRLLLQLEVFLDLTDSTLALASVGKPQGTELLRRFAGSVYSPLFPRSSRTSADTLRRALRSMGDTHTFAGWRLPGPYGALEAGSELAAYRDDFAKMAHCAEKLAYWTGWIVPNLRGQQVCFRLHGMHDQLGHEFASRFFACCETYFAARRTQAMVPINRLDAFIAEFPMPLKPTDFQSRSWLSEFLRKFMKFYFAGLLSNGKAMQTAVDSWSDFTKFLESCVLGAAWVKPLYAVPRPSLRERKWNKTHLRTSADGSTTKTKLITHVPLHISDGEAVELIWHKIEADVEHLAMWANDEADAIWRARQARVLLALSGTVSRQGQVGTNTGLSARTSRSCTDYLAHAAATYKEFGHLRRHDYRGSIHNIYPAPFNTLARELGIPDQLACAAYATLIVMEHPNFNPSVLEDLEVFNDAGEQVGFLPCEGGWRLVGSKLRKGAARAEVSARLGQDLAARVQQMIELTTPLRDYLRARGNPLWKRLFLCASTIAALPKVAKFGDASHLRKQLGRRLQETRNLSAIEAEDLARRFSLARLRASCGVIVYFKTRSVHAMAESLGHTQYDSRLLARYLPPILQEFFVERWIRLFQAGIVCEALKDSPALFRASGFSSQDDLDAFLSTTTGFSTLHTSPPGLPVTQADGAKVIFGLTPSIVRILKELQSRAGSAGKPLNGVAAMWAELGELILENVQADPDLVWMMEASEQVEPPAFSDEAIYA